MWIILFPKPKYMFLKFLFDKLEPEKLHFFS